MTMPYMLEFTCEEALLSQVKERSLTTSKMCAE
jgi:hypothetical protein